ncbi:MAG: putative oxidoreductase C-terminal domain-containing protein [Ginsengibacter sp.]
MKNFLLFLFSITILSCGENKISPSQKNMVKLITLDPGHFHAALVQKLTYDGVDSNVKVYAPTGPDAELHLDRIKAYNSRPDNPANWNEEVYTGDDFLEKMLQENKADSTDSSHKEVVVIAGNNRKKTEYIYKSVEAGLNVLADKPMAIDKKNFELLKSAFDEAKKNNVLLYDIMTERYEITTILQRELSMIPGIFGEQEKGTPENPGITKESVHYFYKYVSGSVLTRPPWFMDVTQEGEGITDVTTHLVDLIQWECFPEQVLDYQKDITLTSARRWPTDITLSQFNTLTKLNGFPGYLEKDIVNDSVLKVYSNGEINYELRGIHAKISVQWNYQAPEGAADSHYSIMRGTKANLIIRQAAEQNYQATLYIEPINKNDLSDSAGVMDQIKSVIAEHPGVSLKKNSAGWEVIIPDKYKEGHEAHFARVTQKFLQYLKDGKIPAWEIAGMIAKYYTTTSALEMAAKSKDSSHR